MKRTVFLALALFALMAVVVYAQTEADFDVTVSKDGKSVTIDRYKGSATTVNIPAKIKNLPVTGIGIAAFEPPLRIESKITSVTIPNGVTSIGQAAFQGCTNLKNVTIPNTVTSIGDTAFARTGITSITIPEGVTTIGSGTFGGTSLTSVIIPNSVTIIKEQAFRDCASLTSVIIPDKVTKIETFAFDGCTKLAEITIGSGVSSIGEHAFSGCTSLTSITFGRTGITSGTNTFINYDSTKSLKNEYTAGGVGLYKRSGNTWTKVTYAGTQGLGFTAINNNKEYSVAKGVVRSGAVVIPATYNNLPVTTIAIEAFMLVNLSAITIPDSVKTIENDAFFGCRLLTSVTIPSSVRQIGDNAFLRIDRLTSVTFQASTTTFYYTFDGDLDDKYKAGGAGTYTRTTGGEIWTKSGSAATGTAGTEADFEVQKSADGKSVTITKYKGTAKVVKIPEKIQNLPVTRIGNAAFEDDGNITSVTIPNGVTGIGNNAFFNCDSLAGITIPNSVTSIGNNVFYGCTSLAGITIPDSVTSIGAAAFTGCTSLTSITIPKNVIGIGSGVFSDCTSLTSVTIPNGVRTILNYAFQDCTSLASITIPASVTGIWNQAFEGCTKLTSVTFAGSITSSNFQAEAFTGQGDIRDKYLAAGGGAGTYTRPDGKSKTWTKK